MSYSIYPTQMKANKMAKDAERTPAMNPAGKAQYEGKVRVFRNEPVINPKPDQGHAARLRGKRARWDKKP